MKRRRLLITGVLLLLGGAIVNVAVSVCFAVSTSQDAHTVPFQMRRFSTIPIGGVQYGAITKCNFVQRVGTVSNSCSINFFGEGFGSISHHVSEEEYLAMLPWWVRRLSPMHDLLHSDKPTWVWTLESNGWPAQSFVGIFTMDFQEEEQGWRADGGIVIEHDDGPMFVPLRPLWPGFAINAIFYAAMLWVVFFVPGMVRRRIRRRRGLCPACAYPIGISPVCTECGKAPA